MESVFKMPVPVTIKARTSSITNAFVNGIIPVIEPTDDQVDEVLNVLGMTRDTICCSYCGDKYTEWDHFRPLILNKQPTGYISEIYNLVPSCGKCNQSKGNQDWKSWMLSEARLSPKTRGIKDINERVKRLESFQNMFEEKVHRLDFEDVVGTELWNEHWNNYFQILKMFDSSQQLSDKIKQVIKDKLELDRTTE